MNEDRKKASKALATILYFILAIAILLSLV